MVTLYPYATVKLQRQNYMDAGSIYMIQLHNIVMKLVYSYCWQKCRVFIKEINCCKKYSYLLKLYT